ncbi:MauE/DoxX family redox-associated membrane protein [Micromonospora sp. DT63]|uniref:MauE/DoxX family redox-associated membrane protein n=1 Tax=Micromonospora sp. DT63 TaxID=3393441 RepID=UPI003CF03065
MGQSASNDALPLIAGKEPVVASISIVGILFVNCVAAALLMQAAAAKTVDGTQLGRALSEIGLPWASGSGLVRLVALLELCAAVALVVEPSRRAGALLVAALGLSFAVVGLVGAVRGSEEPCGCFGRTEGAPFGPVNIAIGVGLLAVAVGNLAVVDAAANQPAGPVIGAALAALLLSLYANRRWILPIVRPLFPQSDRV